MVAIEVSEHFSLHWEFPFVKCMICSDISSYSTSVCGYRPRMFLRMLWLSSTCRNPCPRPLNLETCIEPVKELFDEPLPKLQALSPTLTYACRDVYKETIIRSQKKVGFIGFR